MRKLNYWMFLCCVALCQQKNYAQTSQWESFYSYNNTSKAAPFGQKLVVAAENALLIYDTSSETAQKITTVDGLSGDVISAIAVYESIVLIGHANGLVAQYNTTSQKITYDNSIERNPNLIATQKQVNHIHLNGDMAFLATGFGIVELNPSTLEFGNTYYFGPLDNRIEVIQAYVFQNKLYAATVQGLYSSSVSNPQILEFSSWDMHSTGKWVSLWHHGTDLFGAIDEGSATSLNRIGATIEQKTRYAGTFRNVSKNEDGVVLTLRNKIVLLDPELSTASEHASIPGIKAHTFMFAHRPNNYFLIGTSSNGLVRYEPSEEPQFLSPDGPLENNIFDIETLENELWISHGDYDRDYNPHPLPDQHGVSHYADSQWKNISNDSLFNVDSIVRVVAHPSELGTLYVCSYHGGIVYLKENEAVELWNQNNSGLERLTFAGDNYVSIRVRDAVVDDQGNLWSITAFIERGLKKRAPTGEWTSFDITGAIIDHVKESGYSNLEFYNNKLMFFGGVNSGIMAVDTSQSPPVMKRITGQDFGLPSDDVRSIRLDKDNRLWVGTREGIAVLYAPNRFFEEDTKLNAVVVNDDGNLRELLSGQFITDIEVDGNNQKWISTASSGVFLTNANGTEILHHFTKENSPLPSSSVKTIGIDASTGKVYFGTLLGMTSYLGDAYQPEQDLSSVSLFPNPVRPEYTGNLIVKGLQQDARIKITDIAGNLVYDMTSKGGSVSWDLRSFSGSRVRSGVYLLFISSKDGTDSNVKKVMIIN
jgi:hypothetical protein